MFLTTVNVNPEPPYPYRFYIRNGRDIFLLIISLVYYYDSSVLLGLLSFTRSAQFSTQKYSWMENKQSPFILRPCYNIIFIHSKQILQIIDN